MFMLGKGLKESIEAKPIIHLWFRIDIHYCKIALVTKVCSRVGKVMEFPASQMEFNSFYFYCKIHYIESFYLP